MIDFRTRLSLQRPYMTQHANDQFNNRGSDPVYRHMQLESDRGRIIQSAAIRRLQQKTQVYPLEKNAAVRSRLTHSMEVMQTGRHIVQTIFRGLDGDAELYGLAGLERDIESLVEMACLLHDVGNPPFGHFGEAAINRWFTKQVDRLGAFATLTTTKPATALRQQLITDLTHFEGNAQAIRLTHTLLRLNLTYSQAACILKYTRAACDPRPAADHPFSYLQKKPGYYLSEQQYISDMRHALGMDEGCRYPLSYIMEAADDISYCLADIEDGVEKDIIDHQRLAQLLIDAYAGTASDPALAWLPPGYGNDQPRTFAAAIQDCLEQASRHDYNEVHEFFIRLRVQLIHPLVQYAAQGFINNIEAIFNGNLNRAIMEDDSPYHAVIKTFKSVAFQHFFTNPEVETLDLQGNHILTQILEHYRPLLEIPADDFRCLINNKGQHLLIESLLFKRLPNKHVRAYQAATDQLNTDDQHHQRLWEMYYRCRLIQDMVSGMTDQYALNEYRCLSAIN